MAPEASLGNHVSLEEAESDVNFSFNVPSRLPRGTTLDKIYLHESGDSVRVYYSNPRIRSHCYSGGNSEIGIKFIFSDRDPSSPLQQAHAQN